jgi:hypothetical protein
MIQVSAELREYYKKEGIKAKEVIPVGDFVLKLKNAKMGLLFQSEIDESRSIL